MRHRSSHHLLYAAAGEAAGPGAGLVPPFAAPPEAMRVSIIDLVIGLGLRAALAVQFWTWARANADPVADPLSWRSWLSPSAGLEAAAGVWTLGRVDPTATAFVLLAVATLAALALMIGFMTRIAGLLVMAGALWHAIFVLPEAWPSAAAYGALGLCLALRGAGAVSIDWALARLARIG